jgi:hypothetical protein
MLRTRSALALLAPLSVLAFAACSGGASSQDDAQASEAVSAARRPHHGNVLISDQFNNRVIEVDAKNQIVWSFGDGSSVAGPRSIVAPNDAERIGRYTLISATGAPAGAEPTCDNGCADNRVLIVDEDGTIVWQYGKAGVTGAGTNELNAPVAATYLPNGHILITDQGNARVIEVDGTEIVWQYGTTGTTGTDKNLLNDPNSAELLPSGTVLIADEGNNRVIEVDRAGKTMWSYGDPANTSLLNGPAFASRLPNGDTLVSDAGNNRIVQVSRGGKVVWSFDTSARTGSVAAPNPTRALRLKSGNVLISDQNNHQVIEIDHAGNVVFAQGAIGVAGNGKNQLNAPYDAKVIGDFTGITSPYAAY